MDALFPLALTLPFTYHCRKGVRCRKLHYSAFLIPDFTMQNTPFLEGGSFIKEDSPHGSKDVNLCKPDRAQGPNPAVNVDSVGVQQAESSRALSPSTVLCPYLLECTPLKTLVLFETIRVFCFFFNLFQEVMSQ